MIRRHATRTRPDIGGQHVAVGDHVSIVAASDRAEQDDLLGHRTFEGPLYGHGYPLGEGASLVCGLAHHDRMRRSRHAAIVAAVGVR